MNPKGVEKQFGINAKKLKAFKGTALARNKKKLNDEALKS